MKKYLVGGAVRDKYLGEPVHDKDWVITGASADEMLSQGFQQVGQAFAVFLHPETAEEYALAVNSNRESSASVSIEDDLQRRDLTINAMALDEQEGLIDPYGGKQDLADKCLRHVNEQTFQQDPIRILRTARFAARYHHLGFTIATETMALMQQMVAEGALDGSVSERVWAEIEKALLGCHCAVFIATLRDIGVLKALMPEVDQLFGVPQSAKSHPEIDAGVHTMLVLTQAEQVSEEVDVRFAALLHDLGKGVTPKVEWPKHHGHDKRGVPLVQALCDKLQPPNSCVELALLACRYHIAVHRLFELSALEIVQLLENLDAFRRTERFFKVLQVCQSDCNGRLGFEQADYPQARQLSQWLSDLKVLDCRDIYQQFHGEAIRVAIQEKRVSVVSSWKNNSDA